MKTLKHRFKRIHKQDQLEAQLRDDPNNEDLKELIKDLKHLDKLLSKIENEKRFRKFLKDD